MYCTVPCLVLFLSPSDLGGLVPAMRAMRVVVAAARVAAGEVVVGAQVPILVPVVGLVQIAVGALVPILVPVVGLMQIAVGAVLQLLLLVAVGAVLLLLLVVVGAVLLLLLVAVGAALLLQLLVADGRGAALHLAATGAESQPYDTHAQLIFF